MIRFGGISGAKILGKWSQGEFGLKVKLWTVLFFCGIATLVGCGQGVSDAPNMGKVSGKVTIGGQPATNVIVQFRPVEQGRPSVAEVSSDGQYTLMYTDKVSGAVIGEHVVTLQPLTEADASSDASETALPADATNGTKRVTVEAGSNTIDLDF